MCASSIQGIGDSGQGIANGILFCVFTKVVRQKLLDVLKCVYCHQRWGARNEYFVGEMEDSGLGEEVQQIEQSKETNYQDSFGHNKPLLDIGGGQTSKTSYSALEKM